MVNNHAINATWFPRAPLNFFDKTAIPATIKTDPN